MKHILNTKNLLLVALGSFLFIGSKSVFYKPVLNKENIISKTVCPEGNTRAYDLLYEFLTSKDLGTFRDEIGLPGSLSNNIEVLKDDAICNLITKEYLVPESERPNDIEIIFYKAESYYFFVSIIKPNPEEYNLSFQAVGVFNSNVEILEIYAM